MRILSVCALFYPSTAYGGPSSVALAQAKALVNLGHEVTVLSTDMLSVRPEKHMAKAHDTISGVEVKYFKARLIRARFPFLYAPDALAWIRKNATRADVAHVHLAREIYPITAALELLHCGVPIVVQTHGMLNTKGFPRGLVDRLVIRGVLERAHSALALQSVEERRLREVSRTAVIELCPNGIVRDANAPTWCWQDERQPVVLFLARLDPRKRVLTFIRAAKILVDSGLCLRFQIVGPDGGDGGPARALVRDLGLANRVEFLGPLSADRVREKFASARTYVLPSINEPFPMAVLEALATGTPTIVTTGIHIRTELEQLGAAYIVEPTPTAIASAIGRVSTNRALCERLSASGIAATADAFAMGRVVDTLEEIYASAAYGQKEQGKD